MRRVGLPWRAMLSFLVLAALVPAAAHGQTDHLQCHKAKDTNKFKAAIVALTTAQPEFQLPGNCRVKGRAVELCVPAQKTVVDPGDAPVPPDIPPSEDAAGDYICYKMKCPKVFIPDQRAIDQFGDRFLAKLKKARRICVPASKITSGVCPDDGTAACNAYAAGGQCAACCDAVAICSSACTAAQVVTCSSPPEPVEECATQINAAGCGEVCCP